MSACRKAGISDKTYYYWRKKFGGAPAESASFHR
ncbi:transposase [Planktomarina sp.]